MSKNSTFGRFQNLKWIGKGSQGVVYRATDPKLDRHVAIKLLIRDSDALDGVPVDDLKEGRLASRLAHPNVIPVFEAGEYSGNNFLVFEYVSGKTLRDVINNESPMSIEQACKLIGPILDGISHAHKKGVLHLDLNPRNILVDDSGVPRIMDFGLAQKASTVRSGRELAAGTLRYMTPEHFHGANFGPFTDVFSLGLTFVELVTGRHAMTGESTRMIMSRISTAEIDFTDILQQDDGVAFSHFIQGSLEPDVQHRYADGNAMKVAFDKFRAATGLAPNTSGNSTVDYLMQRMRRKGDFPSLSRSFLALNRLTDENSNTTADKVANVILRDFPLTNKILKLVNSAFYRTASGKISNISQAVVLLGFRQVRMTANSLALFSHLQTRDGSMELRNTMTRAFLAGLLTRFLARKVLPVCPEDAFICGMFQSLGECLVAYYFPEEYREIQELVACHAKHKNRAAKTVLGVSFGTLGAHIASGWNLPDAVVDIIAARPEDVVERTEDPQQSLRDIAVMCNELCDIAGRGNPPVQQLALQDLRRHFSATISLPEATLIQLLSAGLAKLQQFAPILELDLDCGDFYQSAETWINWQTSQSINETQAIAATPA